VRNATDILKGKYSQLCQDHYHGCFEKNKFHVSVLNFIITAILVTVYPLLNKHNLHFGWQLPKIASHPRPFWQKNLGIKGVKNILLLLLLYCFIQRTSNFKIHPQGCAYAITGLWRY